MTKDPKLKEVFDNSGFKLHTVIKDPYTALVGAIIGQKISYSNARLLRGRLYSKYGINIAPTMLRGQDMSFLGAVPASIIANVTEYIIINNVDLNIEDGIRSLVNVTGVGSWTIDTTLLTCLKHWNLFPLADKFLQTRMKRLYGNGCTMTAISSKWEPYRSCDMVFMEMVLIIFSIMMLNIVYLFISPYLIMTLYILI